MKNLVKIGLIRLSKNLYYILGCILAVVITYWVIVTRPIPQLMRHDVLDVAILLSAAITAYFSAFVGLFIGNENEDGILRNKVMVGHTQPQAYFSSYITFIVALVGMMVCWLLGAFAAGLTISSRLVIYILISFLSNAAYIAVVQAIVFRFKKQVVGIMAGIGLLYVLLTSILMGNFFYMITDRQVVMQKIVTVFYNVSALGQCFARTVLSDPGLANTGIQISVSVIVFLAATFLGTLGLGKRDIN